MKSRQILASIAAGILAVVILVFTLGTLFPSYGQSAITSQDRDRGQQMLKMIKEDLKKNYYDPNFHGMDVDARFKAAEDKIKQALRSLRFSGSLRRRLLKERTYGASSFLNTSVRSLD